MQPAAWMGLIQRIPEERHNSLILVTATGAEIVLQRIIRLDRDFMVALGRMAGSTDEGTVLIVPYDQLTYLAFTKKLSDAEIEAALGKPSVAAAVVEQPEAAAPAPAQPATPAPPAAALPTAPPAALAPAQAGPSRDTPQPAQAGERPAAKPNSRIAPPSKSILLAQLRQRLSEDISKQPGK